MSGLFKKFNPYDFELAIRRIFAEAVKCNSGNEVFCGEELCRKWSISLDRWGDPGAMANAGYFETEALCLEVKFTIGYTILAIKNLVENCSENYLEERIGENKDVIIHNLDKYLQQLEQYNCPDDYEKIINLFETIIDKYVFKHDPNSKDAFVLSGCCNREES